MEPATGTDAVKRSTKIIRLSTIISNTTAAFMLIICAGEDRPYQFQGGMEMEMERTVEVEGAVEVEATAEKAVEAAGSAPVPETEKSSHKIGQKLAPYNPTNTDCLDLALGLLSLGPTDVVYDLGCGDGRFLIQVNGVVGCRANIGGSGSGLMFLLLCRRRYYRRFVRFRVWRYMALNMTRNSVIGLERRSKGLVLTRRCVTVM
jgi:hypothetical protein